MTFEAYKRQTRMRRRFIAAGAAGGAVLIGSAVGVYKLLSEDAYQAQAIPLLPGTNYLLLGTHSNALATPGSVEVIAFFSYGSSSCFRLESTLSSWRRVLPGNVSFHRYPVIADETDRLHARAFFAAQKMGHLESLHSKFFEAIHLRSNPLNTKERVLELVSLSGYSKSAFAEWMDGAFASEMLAEQAAIQRRFRIQSLPALGIKSIYYTDVALAGGPGQMLDLGLKLTSI